MTTFVIARKQKRLELIEELLQDAYEYKRERGRHMSRQSRRKRGEKPIPGAETGMIALTYKIIRQGDNTTLIEEHKWDETLESAFTRLLKEGKAEQGGTADSENTGIRRVYIGIDLDKV